MNADDELVVNLIVISKVQINTKLYTSGIYLNLEQPSYIPESVRRWIRQDSRDETIKKINRIVMRALEELKRDPDKNDAYVFHLLEAKKGLLNLRETYSNCIQTVARIDTLISKISSIEPEIETKGITIETATGHLEEKNVDNSDSGSGSSSFGST